jgi:hypothetical protein
MKRVLVASLLAIASAAAVAQGSAPPANMFMVCVGSVRGGNTNYWSAYFEVKEPGHAMSAWKNLPGTFGVFSYGDTDLMGQWVKFAEGQGLKASCAVSGSLAGIMKSIEQSHNAQPTIIQDDEKLSKWRPGPMYGKSFVIATYDRIGQRID